MDALIDIGTFASFRENLRSAETLYRAVSEQFDLRRPCTPVRRKNRIPLLSNTFIDMMQAAKYRA